MKLLLIKPHTNMHVILPPIGLGYLSAYCKSKIKDLDIKIIDCLKDNIAHKQFKELIIKEDPDLVGFTAFSMEITSALAQAKICKEVNKEIKTIIGGPHVSNLPKEVLVNPEVDFVFVGEAEIGLCELIKVLKNKKTDFSKIPGLGYKEGGELKFNKPEFVQNLDELPFPDYELLKLREYPKMYFMKKYPSVPLITSRGCPFSCTFCSAGGISGKKFRARTPENIMEEVEMLKKEYGIKELSIWDDNFTLYKERALKFCDLLIQKNLNLIWWCPNGLRIETLDKELLKKMRDAGCYSIAVGIESGSEKIQKDLKKNLNLKKVEEIVNIADNLGLRTQGFFLLGYPTETKEDILKTIKLSRKLPLYRASFSLFQPLVGSEIYEELLKQGKITDIDLTKCEYSKPSLLPQNLTSLKELKDLQRKAILGFYLRPKIFFRFVLENLNLSQMKELLDIFKKYILDR